MSRRLDQLTVAAILEAHTTELNWPECLELAHEIIDALAANAVRDQAKGQG